MQFSIVWALPYSAPGKLSSSLGKQRDSYTRNHLISSQSPPYRKAPARARAWSLPPKVSHCRAQKHSTIDLRGEERVVWAKRRSKGVAGGGRVVCVRGVGGRGKEVLVVGRPCQPASSLARLGLRGCVRGPGKAKGGLVMVDRNRSSRQRRFMNR